MSMCRKKDNYIYRNIFYSQNSKKETLGLFSELIIFFYYLGI